MGSNSNLFTGINTVSDAHYYCLKELIINNKTLTVNFVHVQYINAMQMQVIVKFRERKDIDEHITFLISVTPFFMKMIDSICNNLDNGAIEKRAIPEYSESICGSIKELIYSYIADVRSKVGLPESGAVYYHKGQFYNIIDTATGFADSCDTNYVIVQEISIEGHFGPARIVKLSEFNNPNPNEMWILKEDYGERHTGILSSVLRI